ncbi:MAG TPA: tetratricopeptide repeat protein [Spirochaetota bacterium]|nr:tetratricopeptide repeat protein [Spirochaetota bacterium]HNT11938.1 tetratricopeptide repeat protein [Spirochaetota bacterium]HNV48596.1 tetratricopeptide repeat protein [Spirochaetota bacterium]HOS41359.1 tetratricopeptide repeat protein [Spirochaetota bacterium]HPU90463.1 tetratricopeptide repeat protein [Spirochaetota bacterium]
MRNYDDIESEDCYDMAVEWLHARDYEKAIDCLKRSIALNPNFVYAYVTLAQAQARSGRLSSAVDTLLHALRVDPAFDRLHWLIAKYAHKRGDIPTALAHVNAAIDMTGSPLYLRGREIILNARKRGRP